MTISSDVPSKSNPRTIVLPCLVAAFGAIPLVLLSPAPLADWPNHLARVAITSKVLHDNAFWSARYNFKSLLIPNAVLDAVVLGLTQLGLSIPLAGTLFLLLCYASFVAGFVCLSKTHRVPPISAACLGSMAFYTGLSLYGLVNFMTGVGLAMLAAAFWMREATSLTSRFLIAVLATPMILFCHVIAALVFAGLCGCYDLVRSTRSFRLRVVGLLPASLALALALIGYKLSAAGSDAMSIGYDGGSGIKSIAIGKARQIAQGLTSGNQVADALFACTILLLGMLFWQRRREIRLNSAAPVLALASLAFLSPNGVGQGLLLDTRLFAWALFTAIALLPWSSRLSRRSEAALISIFVVRTCVLIVVWANYAPVYAEIRTAFATLPTGSTLLDAYDDTPGFYISRQPPLWNIASLAVENGIFVPSVFAEPTQQPLAVNLNWRPLWLWSHSANARTPENLISVHERAARFCNLDPNTHLLLIHVTKQPPFSIEQTCKMISTKSLNR